MALRKYFFKTAFSLKLTQTLFIRLAECYLTPEAAFTFRGMGLNLLPFGSCHRKTGLWWDQLAKAGVPCPIPPSTLHSHPADSTSLALPRKRDNQTILLYSFPCKKLRSDFIKRENLWHSCMHLAARSHCCMQSCELGPQISLLFNYIRTKPLP